MNGRATKSLVARALVWPHRRHRRYRTENLLIDNPVVGRVVNLSQTGFGIETLESLAVGESYLFRVRLGEKHLRLPGRIQWCRLTVETAGDSLAQPFYKAGVALAETVTSKAWQEALKRLTDESAYVIRHRTRSRSSADPLADLSAD